MVSILLETHLRSESAVRLGVDMLSIDGFECESPLHMLVPGVYYETGQVLDIREKMTSVVLCSCVSSGSCI